MSGRIWHWMMGVAGAVCVCAGFSAAAWAANPAPHPGTIVQATPHSYAVLVERLPQAVKANGLGVVARASATVGAKTIGVVIPGNMVVMVFHPKYAIRMLEASVPAGIEAPLRIYITENDDGTATLTYRTATSVFAAYESAGLDAMAAELDPILARIVTAAAAP